MEPSRSHYPVVWVVLGLALACAPASASWFMICGISDVRGCPRNVDTATFLEEAGPWAVGSGARPRWHGAH